MALVWQLIICLLFAGEGWELSVHFETETCQVFDVDEPPYASHNFLCLVALGPPRYLDSLGSQYRC